MATRTHRVDRRTEALSKQRIVGAAIEILDEGGEGALTFRALAARLATGSGAIYHHVADKDALLAAAVDEVVARVTARSAGGEDPREAVRAVALGVFDAIDARPWVGTQLSREPWQDAMLRVLEGFGGPLGALGVPEHAQFDCATALLSYVLGLAGQYAAGARLLPPGTDRSAFLSTVADRWAGLAPEEYPFVRRMADRLPDHDDRAQFLTGIDLLLTGIAAIPS
ncbi:TetR/AcrR family transcriptional regulator [Streptomyces sp. NPDC091281]|uniref:TetR/AcrR family transcriptional regulator n=1 Tax=Streptomyces sp. NPDC091281 TaxID=3365985 RepID=UPI0037FA5551